MNFNSIFAPFGTSFYVIYFSFIALLAFGLFLYKMIFILRRKKEDKVEESAVKKLSKQVVLTAQNITFLITSIINICQYTSLVLSKSVAVRPNNPVTVFLTYTGIAFNLQYYEAILVLTFVWILIAIYVIDFQRFAKRNYLMFTIDYSEWIINAKFYASNYGIFILI